MAKLVPETLKKLGAPNQIMQQLIPGPCDHGEGVVGSTSTRPQTRSLHEQHTLRPSAWLHLLTTRWAKWSLSIVFQRMASSTKR
eukprot:654989-Amphidinium_carterae.4